MTADVSSENVGVAIGRKRGDPGRRSEPGDGGTIAREDVLRHELVEQGLDAPRAAR